MPAYSPPTIRYPSESAQSFDSSIPGSIGTVTDYINQLNRRAQGEANASRIPGAADLEAKSSANIASELQGQLPTDVTNLIGEQAAERGVAIGSPGSPNANSALLRMLGLTSLDLTGRGQQELSGAYARNPAAPLFDPSTMLLTPYQSGTLGLKEQELQLQREEEANRVALEQQKSAQGGAARGGGGGGGAPEAPWQPVLSDPGMVVGGPLGVGPSAQDFTTRDWLNSIGLSPTSTDILGTPLTGEFANLDEFYRNYQQDSGLSPQDVAASEGTALSIGASDAGGG